MGTVKVRVADNKLMIGTDSTGHSIVIGRSPEDESKFLGVKASDLLLLAAAACSAYDVVDILQKQREPFEKVEVSCSGDQESEPPYTFTKIHMRYWIKGAVNPDKLERAIKLSDEKYCSVVATIRPGVPISSDYQIVD